MNYLAHLSLAQPTVESLTGNLMGDFMKGVVLVELPLTVQQGVANHRAVDRFTDHHPAVGQLKPRFSQRYRRFAGIIVDVSFDYFLTKYWHDFYSQPLNEFIDDSYQGLLAGRRYMPVRMKTTVENMAAQNWLSGYQSFDQVVYALDRIAERIRFQNNFSGAGVEAKQQYGAIEQAFLTLYPALSSHAQALKLEGAA